jgi:DNA-binding protein H-NS
MQMSNPETPKSSVMSAIDQMSIQELAALIQVAEKKRQKKLETAQHDLIAEFRARAAELGLSMDALMPPAATMRRTKEETGARLPAKFRGPNGEEWTGRGRVPKWLAALEATGRSRAEFSA